MTAPTRELIWGEKGKRENDEKEIKKMDLDGLIPLPSSPFRLFPQTFFMVVTHNYV